MAFTEQENYVRKTHQYQGLEWLATLKNDGSVLISKAYSKKEADDFLNLIHKKEANRLLDFMAFKIAKSRKHPGNYRIQVSLNRLDYENLKEFPKAARLYVVVKFLNEVHNPLNMNWHVRSDGETKELAVLLDGPSDLNFRPHLFQGLTLNSEMHKFSEKAQGAGFTSEIIKEFKSHLKKDDNHDSRTIYYFTDQGFLTTLYDLAKKYFAKDYKINLANDLYPPDDPSPTNLSPFHRRNKVR